MSRLALIAFALVAMSFVSTAFAQWKPAAAPLMTKWAGDVDPADPLPEYPRPQMSREAWTNLNGLWSYAITGVYETSPRQWDGEILVPFALESALSGVGKSVKPDQLLWYKRTFDRPQLNGGRLLLHFGAVDWQATVYVNGREVADHRGGFDPFTVDVTDALKGDGEQTLVVKVWDPTDVGSQPRGKQVLNPHGIFYTAVTGIWQTVWLEPVPVNHIRSLRITPDIDAGTLTVDADVAGGAGTLSVEVLDGDKSIATGKGEAGKPIVIAMKDAKLWSPDSPHLYNVVVKLDDADIVRSYAGMRKIEMRKDARGINRMFLNNEPVFQYGPLDQGWWPDGLYTAPTDEALRYDIEITKKMGFNMARKHVKVEPARWYYWADKLGLLVWQDMPTFMAGGHKHQVQPEEPNDIVATAQMHKQFMTEWRRIIDTLRSHPSIVVWVPWNEGWGQHGTNGVIEWTQRYDPTRLVDGPSGWQDRGVGHMKDMHNYPGPGMFPVMDNRISVLGEFGGLGWPIEKHLWQSDRNWGYRTYHSKEELARHYRDLIVRLRPLIDEGLAAAVYTQTTDVEGEVNGLLTYDRKIVKLDTDWLAELHAELYKPPVARKVIAATSEQAPQTWAYTTEMPAEGWVEADFDATGWKTGPGGLGTRETPGTVVRTEWSTPNIWARRTVEIDAVDAGADAEWMLTVYHDEDAEVYINGVLAAKLSGYSGSYIRVPLDAAAAGAIKAGRNVIAVHCRQTQGGQYIDLGLLRTISE